jgi:hypothetical protein
MVRYFYIWIPGVALSAVLLFIVPFLGLITAVVFAVGAVTALGMFVWRIVAARDESVRDVLRPQPHWDDAAHRAGAAPAISHRENAYGGLPAHPRTGTALEHPTGVTTSPWPALPYDAWRATCETLHAHTQVLGKLAVVLASPEPQLQHTALRLTARGWETAPLPAPDGSGVFGVALDLRAHEALVEHGDGRVKRVALTPDRPVAAVTHDVLKAVGELVGEVQINPKPQETSWQTSLDEDMEHATYEPAAVERYFFSAMRAALVLSEFRAPYRGRSTPVNAWWGSFDLAVNLFSGEPAEPPSQDFLMRNAMDAQEIAVGWWPGNANYPRAAFYAYAHPSPDGFADADLSPGRWDANLAEFVLDWDAVLTTPDPHATALRFASSVTRHACAVCKWDQTLANSLEGQPPPIVAIGR